MPASRRLNEYGPSRTTVDKVTAIAGLSPGTVSFYFDSKAAMLVAALEQLATEFETQVMAPVQALAGQPVAALNKLVALMVDPEIASARKVSVWYAFWGEATSRQEYSAICGRRDAEFSAMVQGLIERLIAETGAHQLDAEGVALGLVGVFEIVWQSLAFEEEATIDRAVWRSRCLRYLGSVFPGTFAPGTFEAARAEPAMHAAIRLAYDDPATFEREQAFLRAHWSVAAHQKDFRAPGDFRSGSWNGERVLLVRDGARSLHALRNRCRRQPHALTLESHGRFDGEIHCFADGSTYPLDGGTLEPLPVESVHGLVYVRAGVGTARPPVMEAMSPLGDATALEVAADWKVLVEQWLDSAAMTESQVDEAAHAIDWQIGDTYLRFWFPRLLLTVRGPSRRLMQLEPLAAGRTRLEARAFSDGSGAPATSAWAPLQAMASLAESTQLGLEAPGDRPEPEPPIARFRAWYAAAG